MSADWCISLWRAVVIAAFAFWQGGFTFYAAVVVPIGTEVLGSAMDQGTITRRVAVYINLAGGVALLLFAVDNFLAQDSAKWSRAGRWLAWVCMAGALGILIWLHPRMIALLDDPLLDIALLREFRGHHRWYLWISTVQWGASVLYLVLTLRGWQNASVVRSQ